MGIDDGSHEHQAEWEQIAEEYARLRRQLTKQQAEGAQLDKDIAALESRVRCLKQGGVVVPRPRPAGDDVTPGAEETINPGTSQRRHWISVDAILDFLPSSEVLRLIALVGFLFESVLNFFGQRTQWILVKLAATVAGVIMVGAWTAAWQRKKAGRDPLHLLQRLRQLRQRLLRDESTAGGAGEGFQVGLDRADRRVGPRLRR